jgi:hypothetical protein
MRNVAIYLSLFLGLGIGAASAQSINLSGRYFCVNCSPAQPAMGYITQNGRDLNIVNEAGQSTRGYEDDSGRIWTFDWNEAAMVSPDGMTIQFDKGSVWRRDVGVVRRSY